MKKLTKIPITIFYPFILVFYYLRHGILTAVAHIFNTRFVLQHPRYPFPHVIAKENMFYSAEPTPEIRNLLELHRYPVPANRHWAATSQIAKQMAKQPLPLTAIILDGPLLGPPLKQGMVIARGSQTVFIQEEHGRWPTREDCILTTAFNFSNENPFLLLIPLHHIDPTGIHDDTPLSPFQHPVSLQQYLNDTDHVDNTLP